MVDWHLQCLTIYYIRGRHTSGVRNSIINGKFNNGNTLQPISDALVAHGSYDLFDGPILPLSLSVSLRMVGRAEQCSSAKHTPQCAPEGGSKMRVAVMELIRDTKMAHYIIKEQFRHFGCGQSMFPHPSWNQLKELRELVDTHQQCITTLNNRQISYGIHGPHIKFLVRNWNRLQHSLWTRIDVFYPLAHRATPHKLFYVFRELRPPHSRLKGLDCLPNAHMATIMAGV